MSDTENNNVLLHDIVGRRETVLQEGKPLACLQTETSIDHREGDVYIVTYPKTGTTVLQYMCHLLRTKGTGTDFEDIHQVCPHTSSSWFIDQDPNLPQPAPPRLFKSHREIQQVAPYALGVKYIATIRDPRDVLFSLYDFRAKRGQSQPDTVLGFAQSSLWSSSINTASGKTLYDHMATFWIGRKARNFLLLPYEDLVQDRAKWLRLIAEFIGVTISDELINKISAMTSKEAMLVDVHKFDESWVKARRDALGRVNQGVGDKLAPKVRDNVDQKLGKAQSDEELAALEEIHRKLWCEKVSTLTGVSSYEEMRGLLLAQHFPQDR